MFKLLALVASIALAHKSLEDSIIEEEPLIVDALLTEHYGHFETEYVKKDFDYYSENYFYEMLVICGFVAAGIGLYLG
jgi:hypothetical protein